MLHSQLGLHTGSWNFRHFLFSLVNSEPLRRWHGSELKFHTFIRTFVQDMMGKNYNFRVQYSTVGRAPTNDNEEREGSNPNRPVFCVGLICHQLTKSDRA